MQGFFAKNHGSPKYRLINKEGETMPVILHTVCMDSRNDCATFEGTVLPGEYYRKTTERTINDIWPNLYVTTGRHQGRSFLMNHMRNCMYGGFLEPDKDWEPIPVPEELISLVRNEKYFGIKKVIFNDPATIVFWNDGTKTVVKCQEGDIFDPEKGLAMAISKRALGDKGNFNDVFKKWVPEKDDFETMKMNTQKVIATIRKNIDNALSFGFHKSHEVEPEFINHIGDTEYDQR